MLERLAGNDALKAELGTALRGGRLPHAVLLVGEPGCGAGFAEGLAPDADTAQVLQMEMEHREEIT